VSSEKKFKYATCLPRKHHEMASYMWCGNPILHTSVLFHRTSVQEIGGYSEDMKHGQDLDLWNRAAVSNLKMMNLDRIAVLLTTRGDSITARTLDAGDRYSNLEILTRSQSVPPQEPIRNLYSLTVLLPSIRKDYRELARVFWKTPLVALGAVAILGLAQLKGRVVFFFIGRKALSLRIPYLD